MQLDVKLAHSAWLGAPSKHGQSHVNTAFRKCPKRDLTQHPTTDQRLTEASLTTGNRWVPILARQLPSSQALPMFMRHSILSSINSTCCGFLLACSTFIKPPLPFCTCQSLVNLAHQRALRIVEPIAIRWHWLKLDILFWSFTLGIKVCWISVVCHIW